MLFMGAVCDGGGAFDCALMLEGIAWLGFPFESAQCACSKLLTASPDAASTRSFPTLCCLCSQLKEYIAAIRDEYGVYFKNPELLTMFSSQWATKLAFHTHTVTTTSSSNALSGAPDLPSPPADLLQQMHHMINFANGKRYPDAVAAKVRWAKPANVGSTIVRNLGCLVAQPGCAGLVLALACVRVHLAIADKVVLDACVSLACRICYSFYQQAALQAHPQRAQHHAVQVQQEAAVMQPPLQRCSHLLLLLLAAAHAQAARTPAATPTVPVQFLSQQPQQSPTAPSPRLTPTL
jgi:hypothetical protein